MKAVRGFPDHPDRDTRAGVVVRRELLERLNRGEKIDHYETVRVARDGRRINISLTVSPLRDGSGRVVGASKVARDITERKRAEQLQHRWLAFFAGSEGFARPGDGSVRDRRLSARIPSRLAMLSVGVCRVCERPGVQGGA